MVVHYVMTETNIYEDPEGAGQISIFINPSEEEKRHLVDDWKVDEHTLASALDPDELGRLEFEPEHVAMIFKCPRSYSAEDRFLFKVSSMGFFLYKDRLIILMSENTPIFEGKPFTKNLSLAHVMLKTIYRNISHFIAHLKIINTISDELENKVNTAMENRYLLSLFVLEKSLVYYLNAINSNSLVIEKIHNNEAKIGISGELSEFLDDLIIENTQCYKQAEIYSNILTGLMDARGSIVGNNLNVLMKTLNIITIGIMVPTLVVSIFSMNVGIPLSSHPQAFWMIIGVAAISMLGFLLFWKFKKW